MKKEDKLSALDPRFKKQIQELFENMNKSIDLLYEAATHDEKTGLYNNKFFNNIFDMEIEKAKRGKQKLSLVLIDIDFFKKINDVHGHLKADFLLKKLSELLKKTIRKSDILARFGGEEFFILLPETNLDKTKKLTKRIRAKIKSDKVLKKYEVSVSGGIAEYKKGMTKRKFKELVDKRLYKAKKTGRDKFCFK